MVQFLLFIFLALCVSCLFCLFFLFVFYSMLTVSSSVQIYIYTFHEHLGSSLCFGGVHVAHLFCVYFIGFVLCLVSTMF
jgi:hypothetical protein